jgi:ubiquinone/menaquinone biosynthesis C-methylase UbiE
LPYVALLALLGESNLPPGGFDTIRRLAVNLHLRAGVSALHAGCNTAFLGCELARRTGASVVAVDISQAMVKAAGRRISEHALGDQVTCQVEDMRRLSFADASFDSVFSGGALAFVDGHERAIDEWLRVVKPGGLVADAELFYHTSPPASLLQRVSSIIEVRVPEYDETYWRRLFDRPALRAYYRHRSQCEYHSDAIVRAYCSRMVEWSAHDWKSDAQEALFARLLAIMSAFNENMKYLAYDVLVYQRVSDHEQPALFV